MAAGAIASKHARNGCVRSRCRFARNTSQRQQRDGYVGGNIFVYFSLSQVRHQDFRGTDVFEYRALGEQRAEAAEAELTRLRALLADRSLADDS